MESRLFDHLTSRINADLDLLVELGRLQPNGAFLVLEIPAQADVVPDAAVIRSRLPPVSSTPASTPLAIAPPPQQTAQQPVGRIVPPLPQAKPVTPKNLARALWDYSSATPGDLNFVKGDVIEILAEENEQYVPVRR